MSTVMTTGAGHLPDHDVLMDSTWTLVKSYHGHTCCIACQKHLIESIKLSWLLSGQKSIACCICEGPQQGKFVRGGLFCDKEWRSKLPYKQCSMCKHFGLKCLPIGSQCYTSAQHLLHICALISQGGVPVNKSLFMEWIESYDRDLVKHHQDVEVQHRETHNTLYGENMPARFMLPSDRNNDPLEPTCQGLPMQLALCFPKEDQTPHTNDQVKSENALPNLQDTFRDIFHKLPVGAQQAMTTSPPVVQQPDIRPSHTMHQSHAGHQSAPYATNGGMGPLPSIPGRNINAGPPFSQMHSANMAPPLPPIHSNLGPGAHIRPSLPVTMSYRAFGTWTANMKDLTASIHKLSSDVASQHDLRQQIDEISRSVVQINDKLMLLLNESKDQREQSANIKSDLSGTNANVQKFAAEIGLLRTELSAQIRNIGTETKQDIADNAQKSAAENGLLHTELAEIKQDIVNNAQKSAADSGLLHTVIKEIKKDIVNNAQKSEADGDLLCAGMTEIKQDMTDTMQEFVAEIGLLRTEFSAEIRNVVTEIKQVMATHSSKTFSEVQTLQAQNMTLEKTVDKLGEQLSAQLTKMDELGESMTHCLNRLEETVVEIRFGVSELMDKSELYENNAEVS